MLDAVARGRGPGRKRSSAAVKSGTAEAAVRPGAQVAPRRRQVVGLVREARRERLDRARPSSSTSAPRRSRSASGASDAVGLLEQRAARRSPSRSRAQAGSATAALGAGAARAAKACRGGPVDERRRHSASWSRSPRQSSPKRSESASDDDAALAVARRRPAAARRGPRPSRPRGARTRGAVGHASSVAGAVEARRAHAREQAGSQVGSASTQWRRAVVAS